MSRKCLNNPDDFCYVCGSYIMKKQRENITNFVCKAYHAYFGIKLGDQGSTCDLPYLCFWFGKIL